MSVTHTPITELEVLSTETTTDGYVCPEIVYSNLAWIDAFTAIVLISAGAVFFWSVDRGRGWNGAPHPNGRPKELDSLAGLINVFCGIMYVAKTLDWMEEGQSTFTLNLYWYLDYTLSCPLIILDLAFALDLKHKLRYTSATGILLAIAVVIFITETVYRWAYFTMGLIGFTIFSFMMYIHSAQALKKAAPTARADLRRALYIFFFGWPFFPILYMLSWKAWPGKSWVICEETYFVLHAILDIACKTLFGCFMVRARLFQEDWDMSMEAENVESQQMTKLNKVVDEPHYYKEQPQYATDHGNEGLVEDLEVLIGKLKGTKDPPSMQYSRSFNTSGWPQCTNPQVHLGYNVPPSPSLNSGQFFAHPMYYNNKMPPMNLNAAHSESNSIGPSQRRKKLQRAQSVNGGGRARAQSVGSQSVQTPDKAMMQRNADTVAEQQEEDEVLAAVRAQMKANGYEHLPYVPIKGDEVDETVAGIINSKKLDLPITRCFSDSGKNNKRVYKVAGIKYTARCTHGLLIAKASNSCKWDEFEQTLTKLYQAMDMEDDDGDDMQDPPSTCSATSAVSTTLETC